MQTWIAFHIYDDVKEPLLDLYSSIDEALAACAKHNEEQALEIEVAPAELDYFPVEDKPGAFVEVVLSGDFWDERGEGYNLYRLNDRA